MQIVDQHQPQIVEPAAFRVDLRDRDSRIVVHADIRLAERGRGDRELSPVFLIQMTGRELLVLDEAFCGQKAHDQLFARHFERKERDSLFIGLRHVQADIERDSRLAHTGTGCDQNQVSLVQAVDLAVKIVKSGRQAGDLAAGGRQLFQPVVDVDHDLADVLQAVTSVAAPERIDLFLRNLEHFLRRADAVVDHFRDFRRCGRQRAQERLVMHDRAVLLDIGGGRRDLQQLRDVIIAALLVIHAALFHLIEYGNRVDLFREVEHRIDRLVDLTVLPEIKIVRLQHTDHVRHAALVDQHRAENGLLRLQCLRGLPLKQFLIHRCSHPSGK